MGLDLLKQGRAQQMAALGLPFILCGSYFLFASLDMLPPALLCAIALSFVTYASTSHDLVHGNLGLGKGLNGFLLFLIELSAIRSGHAYRAAHLHHHSRYPGTDDIEGEASKMSFLRALFEGLVFQMRIYHWAYRNVRAPADRIWIRIEGLACAAMIAAAFFLFNTVPAFSAYVALMIAGSWIIPLMTSYVPHTPDGTHVTRQTRMFRGKVLSIIALEHLYHLEHHMYPRVPRANWPKLAVRLEGYFREAGVRPCKLWF